MSRIVKAHPKQCQHGCTTAEEMAQARRTEQMPQIIREIQDRLANMQEQTVIVGALVNGALRARTDFARNRRVYGSLADFYTSLVRNHLNFFKLIYNEEIKVIQKLVEDLPSGSAEPPEGHLPERDDHLIENPPKRRRRNANQLCLVEAQRIIHPRQ